MMQRVGCVGNETGDGIDVSFETSSVFFTSLSFRRQSIAIICVSRT